MVLCTYWIKEVAAILLTLEMQQVTQKSQDSLISIENEWRNEKANGFILIDIYKILNLLWDDIPCILPLLQYDNNNESNGSNKYGNSNCNKYQQNKNNIPYHSNANIMTMEKYSPKQSLKFYGSRDPRLVTAWPENTILKIESIPHHFTAFSIRNLPHPSVTVHYLDYVTITAWILCSQITFHLFLFVNAYIYNQDIMRRSFFWIQHVKKINKFLILSSQQHENHTAN